MADGHGANGHFVSQFIAQHMPKQYETEMKRLERQKHAKELVSGGKSSANKGTDSESTSHRGNDQITHTEDSLDRITRKALTSTYL